MLLQRDLNEQSLETALVDLLRDAPRRKQMAERARLLARPGALERIAGMIVRLAHG